MKHELQHPDSPTWCVNCGRFDHACKPDEECQGKRLREFDCQNREAFRRMYQSMFPSESVVEDLEKNYQELGGEG